MGLLACEDQPLLPVPLAGNKWSSAAVDGFDFGLHLRGLLVKLDVPLESVANIGSHSCKCTCLSWAAKGCKIWISAQSLTDDRTPYGLWR